MAHIWQAQNNIEPIAADTIASIANAIGGDNAYNVLSGCAQTYSAANMEKTVAAGSVTFNGTMTAVAGDDVTLVSDPSNPRWTITAIDNTGAPVIISGDPAAAPSVPELGNNVMIGLDLIQAGQTIADNIVTQLDKRVFGSGPPSMTLVASSDTPVATTSTSQVDIVVISGLSIPVTSSIRIMVGVSKDALATNSVAVGLKLNAVDLGTSTVMGAAIRVEDGGYWVEIGPRSADAPNGIIITRFSRVTATGAAATAVTSTQAGSTAMPVAEITSITITGVNNIANNNLTIESYRIWELPV